ncbi:MAG TPA: NAD(P)H-dependent oxidoreductase [Acidimicrobiales bacterium]|nr:NAD(P)H-dependent oxidoreductase [Acidimicrobiales bacterium]
MSTTAVVVGNPKPASRTLDAAVRVATALTGRPPEVVIDVVELGPGVLTWGDPGVAEAVTRVRQASVLVAACPTYKASFTGLLKVFLDQFPSDGLAGVVAFPLMLGGAWQHSLAPDVFLKPVLVELGATCPAKGLYLLDSDYEDPPELQDWLERARTAMPEAGQ